MDNIFSNVINDIINKNYIRKSVVKVVHKIWEYLCFKIYVPIFGT